MERFFESQAKMLFTVANEIQHGTATLTVHVRDGKIVRFELQRSTSVLAPADVDFERVGGTTHGHRQTS